LVYIDEVLDVEDVVELSSGEEALASVAVAGEEFTENIFPVDETVRLDASDVGDFIAAEIEFVRDGDARHGRHLGVEGKRWWGWIRAHIKKALATPSERMKQRLTS